MLLEATVCLIFKDELLVANVGDSECLIGEQGQDGFTMMTTDDRPVRGDDSNQASP